jgi:hypothetical protein
VLPDAPTYDEAAAQRHWTTLTALLDDTLKGGAEAP